MKLGMIKAKLKVLIPSQVKSIRMGRGMSQKQLATAAGMLQSRIADIEMPGKANLTIDTLARLAAAFGLAVKIEFVRPEDMLKWGNEYYPSEIAALLGDKGKAE